MTKKITDQALENIKAKRLDEMSEYDETLQDDALRTDMGDPDFEHRASLQDLHHDGRHREIPDPVPMAPPVGWYKQKSMFEQMRELIRSEALAREAEAAGYETPEEADDLEIGDDFDPTSPYEHDFDHIPPSSEVPPGPAKAPPAPPSDGPATPPAADASDGGSVPPKAP